jgi:hypothetical protein
MKKIRNGHKISLFNDVVLSAIEGLEVLTASLLIPRYHGLLIWGNSGHCFFLLSHYY